MSPPQKGQFLLQNRGMATLPCRMLYETFVKSFRESQEYLVRCGTWFNVSLALRELPEAGDQWMIFSILHLAFVERQVLPLNG